MASMDRLDCKGMSDPGHIRGVNDDQFLIADLRKSIFVHQTSLHLEDHTPVFGSRQGCLLIVADGGGGWAMERQASALAVRTITQYILNMMPWLYRLDMQHEGDFLEDLTTALAHSQGRIHDVISTADSPREIAASLTMAYITWPRLYVVHVGNCRCYLLRRDRLEQITTDHTLAQQLVESGVMRQEEAASSQLSQVLWNAIGGDDKALHPEVYKAELHSGDVLLLCTDGLPHHVTDDNIRTCLQGHDSAQATCQALIDLAKADGGTDNITTIVARFSGEALSVEEVLEEMTEHEVSRPPVTAAEPIPETSVPQPAAHTRVVV